MIPEKAERIHRYYRTPKAVMRALEKATGETTRIGREAEPYEKEAIMQWVNAAAPMAASELIRELVSEEEDTRHKAAVKILEWCIGRPPAQEGGVKASVQFGDRRVEVTIVDPPNGNIIDAGAAEGGALTVQ
jgi:hypothetical protein